MAVTLDPVNTAGSISLTNGDLTASIASSAAFAGSRSTHAAASGQYYLEVTLTTGAGFLGVGNSSASIATFPGAGTTSYGWYSVNDLRYYNGGTLGQPTHTSGTVNMSYAAGSVIGILIDATARTLKLTTDGTNISDSISLSAITGDLYAFVGTNSTGATTWDVNFGDTAMAYGLPSGYSKFSTLAGGGGGGADPAASIMRAMFGRAHYGIRR